MHRKLLIGTGLVLCLAGAAWWYLDHQAVPQSANAVDAASAEAEAPATVAHAGPAGHAAPSASELGQVRVDRPVSWPEIEKTMVLADRKAVDSGVAHRLLRARTQEFRTAMDALENEMLRDPLASELGDHYRALMLDQLGQVDGQGLRMDRFACSGQVCVAQMSGSDEAWNAFGERLRQAGVETFPAYARALNAYRDEVDGRTDYRMLFTTDPRFNAFRGAMTAPMILKVGRVKSRSAGSGTEH